MTDKTNDNQDHGLPFEDVTGAEAQGETQDAGPARLISPREALNDLLNQIGEAFQAKQEGRPIGGILTGFSLVDENLRGLRPGSFTILSAMPNIGKTTLAVQMAFDAVTFPGQNIASLYVTWENTPADLILKQAARYSGWPASSLEGGDVNPNDPQLQEAIQHMMGLHTYFVRGGMDTGPDFIIEKAKEVQQIVGPEGRLLIGIDYLQKFARHCKGGTEYEKISTALSELRRIADETQAALLVIGSQNREGSKSNEASMFSQRGNGEIEYDADNIIVMTKEEDAMTPNKILVRKLKVVKGRFGGADAHCELYFYPDQCEFSSELRIRGASV